MNKQRYMKNGVTSSDSLPWRLYFWLCIAVSIGLLSEASAQPKLDVQPLRPDLPPVVLNLLMQSGAWTADIEWRKFDNSGKRDKSRSYYAKLTVTDGLVRIDSLRRTKGWFSSSKSQSLSPYYLYNRQKHEVYTVLEAIDGFARSTLVENNVSLADLREIDRDRVNGAETIRWTLP